MAERWVLTPAGGKALVLAHTPQRGGCRVIGVQTPPPARRVQWSNRREGSLPTSKEYENREVTLTLQLAPPADPYRFQTYDFGTPAPEAEGDGDVPGYAGTVRRVSADNNPVPPMISDLQSTIAECAANGGTLRRVMPSGQAVTFDVQDAEGPDGPTWDIAYYAGKTTPIPVRFVCSPFARGDETLLGQGTKAAGQRFLSIGGLQVSGDVPALARLEYSAATAAQQSLLYSIDQPDTASTATGLQIAATALLAAPGSTSTTQAGSVATNVRSQPSPGTAAPAGFWSTVGYLRRAAGDPIPLTGQYRVLLRVYRTGTDAPLTLRMRWSGGSRESGVSANAAWTSAQDGWQLADLGIVTITDALDGVIERQSPNTTALISDALLLVPTDRSACAYASTSTVAGVILAADAATGTGNLTGSTASVGGTWASTGASPGFVRGTTGATRTAGAGRRDFLSTSSANVEASAVFVMGKRGIGGIGPSILLGNDAGIAAIASGGTTAAGGWALAAYFQFSGNTYNDDTIGIVAAVDGQPLRAVSYATVSVGTRYMAPEILSLAYNSGAVRAVVGGVTLTADAGIGAPPASGLRVGIGSSVDDGNTMRFRDFAVTGSSDPDRLLHPSKTATIATDRSTRTTPAGFVGTFLPLGDRPSLPPSGRAGRAVRVQLGVSRDDLRSGLDTVASDAFTGKVYATPRWLQIPGS